MQRFIADLTLLGSALFFPWWMTFLLGIGFYVIFPWFLEFIVVAFYLDLIFGAPVARFGGFEFILTFVALGIYLAGIPLKKRMRVWGNHL